MARATRRLCVAPQAAPPNALPRAKIGQGVHLLRTVHHLWVPHTNSR